MKNTQDLASLQGVVQELRREIETLKATVKRLRTDRDQYKKLAKERLDLINGTYDRQNG